MARKFGDVAKEKGIEDKNYEPVKLRDILNQKMHIDKVLIKNMGFSDDSLLVFGTLNKGDKENERHISAISSSAMLIQKLAQLDTKDYPIIGTFVERTPDDRRPYYDIE